MNRFLQRFNETMKSFREDQSGIGVVEIILILVILIGLVLIFKNQISAIITEAFDAINADSGAIVS